MEINSVLVLHCQCKLWFFLLILHIFLFALGCSWYFDNFLQNYWNKSPAKKYVEQVFIKVTELFLF